MGFDYEIEYKQRCENKTPDALSWLPRDLLAVSCPKPTWVDVIRDEACNHPDLVAIREAAACGDPSATSFAIKDGLLWHKGRLVLPSTSQHKQQIIHEFNNTLVGGHSWNLRTYKRLWLIDYPQDCQPLWLWLIDYLSMDILLQLSILTRPR